MHEMRRQQVVKSFTISSKQFLPEMLQVWRCSLRKTGLQGTLCPGCSVDNVGNQRAQQKTRPNYTNCCTIPETITTLKRLQSKENGKEFQGNRNKQGKLSLPWLYKRSVVEVTKKIQIKDKSGPQPVQHNAVFQISNSLLWSINPQFEDSPHLI